ALLNANRRFGVKVLTNPTFTVGQDKEICPNLVALEDKFPFTKKIVDFLTYDHRRKCILGGGADLDDEYPTGYLSIVRPDGRIPTRASTCDAATSRMKHKGVANV